jgi:hypothetical protein
VEEEISGHEDLGAFVVIAFLVKLVFRWEFVGLFMDASAVFV